MTIEIHWKDNMAPSLPWTMLKHTLIKEALPFSTVQELNSDQNLPRRSTPYYLLQKWNPIWFSADFPMKLIFPSQKAHYLIPDHFASGLFRSQIRPLWPSPFASTNTLKLRVMHNFPTRHGTELESHIQEFWEMLAWIWIHSSTPTPLILDLGWIQGAKGPFFPGSYLG